MFNLILLVSPSPCLNFGPSENTCKFKYSIHAHRF
jgi:hypothetical protein